MDDEVALERASQQVIKILLREPEFLDEWQRSVGEELEGNPWIPEDLETKPCSSSCHVINSIESTVSELASTIEYVISTFELNVDPRDCYLADAEQSNRNASQLFEAGLKVEKLTNLDMKSVGKEAVAAQISTACRRVNQVLKSFGRRFQGQQSLELHVTSSTVRRLCRLFYAISEEILRFSAISDAFSRKNERKSVEKLSRKLHEKSDEFNLKVVAKIEQTMTYLKKEKKRKETANSRPKIVPKTPPKIDLNLQKVKTKRQIRLVSSIQEAIRQVENSTEKRGKTHVAGGIATSIVAKQNGLLYEETKPKPPRNNTIFKKSIIDPPISTNIDSDRNLLDQEDYEVMKSAMRVTGLVIEDMKHTMRIGNDEHIVLGVGK